MRRKQLVSLWVFVLTIQMIKLIQSNQIKSYSSVCCTFGILGILDIFFIIKCVGLEHIIFTINLVVSSCNAFSIFDYMFIPILLT